MSNYTLGAVQMLSNEAACRMKKNNFELARPQSPLAPYNHSTASDVGVMIWCDVKIHADSKNVICILMACCGDIVQGLTGGCTLFVTSTVVFQYLWR